MIKCSKERKCDSNEKSCDLMMLELVSCDSWNNLTMIVSCYDLRDLLESFQRANESMLEGDCESALKWEIIWIVYERVLR